MRNDRFRKTSISLQTPAWARAFSMSELLVVVLIIVVVLAVAVPSFTTVMKDIELKQARSDVFAALSAARSRAIRDRQMVALHIFYDNGAVYQTNPRRWGSGSGTPHNPSNKMTMRLETAYRADTATNSVEFRWLNDHDPIILPDDIGICRPNTILTETVDVSNEFVPALAGTLGQLNFARDFYVVFADDGKLASVRVDYASYYDSGNPADVDSTPVATVVSSTVAGTVSYSAMGLCIYDTQKFKSLTDDGDADMTEVDQYSYANRSDNQVMISPYTGMPLSMEVNK